MDTASHPFLGAYDEHAFATVDGLSVYFRDYPPLAPVTGAPVICLHGLTRNSKDFETIAPRIAALGRRVIVPDMRGRGQSANDSDPEHYVPAVYAQDVLRLLDRLEIPQAVFVGTSMGGLITLIIATLAPDRIAASVLNDIGPRIEVSGLARLGTYVGRGRPLATWEEARDAARAINADAFPDRVDDDAFWDVVVRRTYRQNEDGQIEADYDPNIALVMTDPTETPPPDLTPLFEHLAKKPLLSLRGELSDILSPDGVALMRGLKPDLHAAEVPRVGHAPMLDEPEAWDALLDFLARVD
ncbi:probable hydrolase [alpha proteobacterium U9-1i]|nr:probable hydrolase [alpha proteobacterium U9-1i]